jgi:hypothetical protein
MNYSNTTIADGSQRLITEIIETLEENGHSPDTYTLYNHVDLDGVKQVLGSSDDAEVRFTIEDVRLVVTAAGDVRQVE